MKYTKELAVGLSLVVTAVIFVLGIRYFEDLPLFRGTYALNTSFENTDGLNKGNAVRVNGVRVGAVDDVRLDPQANGVLVRFHVDEDIAIPEGSVATLGGIAALASIHLEIELGPAGNERVEEGGFIPGRTGGGIMDLVSSKGPELAQQVDDVLTSANATLDEAEVLFESAGGDVQQTMAAFRQAAVTLEQTLRAEQQSLHRTMANLETFSEDVSGFTGTSSDTLAVAVQRLNRSMMRLETSLDQLEVTTATLDEILQKINTGDGTVARMINDPAVYERLDSTLAGMQRIMADFQADPKKYLRHLDLVDVF